MTSKLKEIAGTVILGGTALASIIGGAKYIEFKDPMGNAKDAYIVVESRDNMYGLCQKEGWTSKEIESHGVQNWNSYIKPGDIVGIPQKDNPRKLGLTGRDMYESREKAEEAIEDAKSRYQSFLESQK